MIADPVLAELIREDARQTLADQLAAIDEIQAAEYVNYRLEYYERNIGDLITASQRTTAIASWIACNGY